MPFPSPSTSDTPTGAHVIVPVLNGGAQWSRGATALSSQRGRPARVLIIDSGSTDGSDRVALDAGFELVRIDKRDFDHGGTRQRAAQMCSDADILVYMTQDAELAEPQALEALLRCFDDPSVAAAYGRQLPRREAGPIEAHARLFNYPDRSELRTMADAERLGLRTAFMSNSFAAYRRADLMAVGGFPERLILAEDMVAAARLLKAGKSVCYAAHAQVFHSHGYTVRQEMKRYFDIGVLHTDQAWLLKEFGRAEGEGGRFVRSEIRYLLRRAPWLLPEAAVRTVAKYLGYRLGRHYCALPWSWCRRLSMHRGYWSRRG